VLGGNLGPAKHHFLEIKLDFFLHFLPLQNALRQVLLLLHLRQDVGDHLWVPHGVEGFHSTVPTHHKFHASSIFRKLWRWLQLIPQLVGAWLAPAVRASAAEHGGCSAATIAKMVRADPLPDGNFVPTEASGVEAAWTSPAVHRTVTHDHFPGFATDRAEAVAGQALLHLPQSLGGLLAHLSLLLALLLVQDSPLASDHFGTIGLSAEARLRFYDVFIEAIVAVVNRQLRS